MLIPINSSQISKLIPAVGTGSQFKYALGNPRKILQRVIVSSIGGFISLIISSTGDQTNNFWLFLCVGFFLYIIWGPILESSRKNLQLRKYKFFSIFDGYISDIYKTEKIESSREQSNRQGRLEVIENKRTWLVLELEDEDEDSTILVKLYDPLPSEFDLKSQLWIVEELSDPQAYRIEFPEEIIEVKDFEYIKGPNYNIDVVQQVGEATETVSFSSLLSTPQTSSLQQLKSLLEEKGININVNYGNFNEFVKFSSALTRLENFYYKAKVIENAQNDLNTYIYSISGPTTSSVSYSSSRASLETTINSTIEGFDGYEYFLYFNSGSNFSWPKSNTTPPYTLYSTGSTEVIDWLGSANESLSTYGGVALSASNYDQNNLDRLYNTIPEYLVEDPQNQNYELFIDMIAQHFDNIWLYTKDITNRFNADNRLEYGISKDLVADAIKEFGVKLYQNNYSTEDLYAAFLGITPSGSLFPVSNITGSSPQEGQEIVTTYVSGSNDVIPLNDVNKKLYKKIYHNLPFLLKSKGTMKGLKALISTFGIPSTILEPKEFGGRKKQDSVYDRPEEKFNYALKLDGSSTYVETDWQLNSNWNSRNDVPTSMILRFKAQEVPSTYIPVAASQSLFRTNKGALLSLEYTGTAGTSGSYSGSIVDPEYQYGNLRFYPSGSDGVSTSISLPFFDGGWWSVMIQYDTTNNDTFNLYASNKSSNDQLTQQVKFSSNSSVESEYNYWSGSSTAYFGSEVGGLLNYKDPILNIKLPVSDDELILNEKDQTAPFLQFDYFLLGGNGFIGSNVLFELKKQKKNKEDDNKKEQRT